MRVVVPAESKAGEKRVALLPDIISKLTKAGLSVSIESRAGIHAGASDESYIEQGAAIFSASDQRKELAGADVILSVQPLNPDQASNLKSGVITISFLSSVSAKESIDALAKSRATAFSLEALPRISRAQSMDALTSQALCAGYKAALVAAELSPRFFPLLMTAAGTVTPANVLVLGAGVAGLQAIATSRRLGAVVSAYDVRPSSADEVKSMGAAFIDLELEALEGSGGYAREMSEERAAKQRELLTPYITKSHVLITTAAVPGRAAPMLVTKQMYQAMAPGSVIVDLAAESGGNVEGSKPGEVITVGDSILLWGGKDVPSQLPFHSSYLLSRNMVNLLLLMVKDGAVVPDFSDEIIDASALTHGGNLRKGS